MPRKLNFEERNEMQLLFMRCLILHTQMQLLSTQGNRTGYDEKYLEFERIREQYTDYVCSL